MKRSKEERAEANRERVARWRAKNGWVGKQRAREASKRWYARKLAKEGRRVRGRAGRPRIDELSNFSDIPKTESKGLEFRHMGETHIEAFGPGVDMAYEERVYQNRKSAGEPGIVRAIMERAVEVSEEEAERTRATLAQLEILKERKASGGLNAGVEVELEL
jgi:hypothetical protein